VSNPARSPEFSALELEAIAGCLRNQAARFRRYAQETAPGDATPAELAGYEIMAVDLMALAAKADGRDLPGAAQTRH